MPLAKDVLLGLTSLQGSATAAEHFKSIDLTGPITVVNNPIKLVDRLIKDGNLYADIADAVLTADVENVEASTPDLGSGVNAVFSVAEVSSFVQ